MQGQKLLNECIYYIRANIHGTQNAKNSNKVRESKLCSDCYYKKTRAMLIVYIVHVNSYLHYSPRSILPTVYLVCKLSVYSWRE